jgi:hypothetical protein
MKRDTGREASLDEELTGAKGGKWRLLGRLKDHGVAASQRRAELEGQQEGRRNVRLGIPENVQRTLGGTMMNGTARTAAIPIAQKPATDGYRHVKMEEEAIDIPIKLYLAVLSR